MQFISESVIDRTVEMLSDLDSVDQLVEKLGEEQPTILAYLDSENMDAFSDSEKDFLLFSTLVIWQSVTAVESATSMITVDVITEAEEANFELIGTVKEKLFRDRMTVFFDNYPQEDLLAFVEDALEDDEESGITREGREYLFIVLKTIIDGYQRTV